MRGMSNQRLDRPAPRIRVRARSVMFEPPDRPIALPGPLLNLDDGGGMKAEDPRAMGLEQGPAWRVGQLVESSISFWFEPAASFPTLTSLALVFRRGSTKRPKTLFVDRGPPPRPAPFSEAVCSAALPASFAKNEASFSSCALAFRFLQSSLPEAAGNVKSSVSFFFGRLKNHRRGRSKLESALPQQEKKPVNSA